MVSRFRQFEKKAIANGERGQRQVVIGVTANRSDELVATIDPINSFDCVVSKPLEINSFAELISRYIDLNTPVNDTS